MCIKVPDAAMRCSDGKTEIAGRAALLVVLLMLGVVGCSNRPSAANQQGLQAAIGYVTNFKGSHDRLPTREEFDAWRAAARPWGVVDYEQGGPSHPESLPDGEFRLYSWESERMWVYSSADGTCNQASR